MTQLVTGADVTTILGYFTDNFEIIYASLILLAGLFIAKGGYQWVLGMIEKAFRFGK